jgi:hypothetical protein
MRQKFLRIQINTLFDRALLFGQFVKKDVLGNAQVKILRHYSRMFAKTPKKNFLRFLGFRDIVAVWYDDAKEKDDWHVGIGQVITLPAHSDVYDIEEISKSEMDRQVSFIEGTIRKFKKAGFIDVLP